MNRSLAPLFTSCQPNEPTVPSGLLAAVKRGKNRAIYLDRFGSLAAKRFDEWSQPAQQWDRAKEEEESGGEKCKRKVEETRAGGGIFVGLPETRRRVVGWRQQKIE